ncbi:hypothetical protein C900_02574 [Fulvivirga imtechensis AK7]|uniref:Uncharacterized protein n=1 Tax=Fulvivirga imtechensis AK7 TaxID=1237149 RepID=L8JRB0_9BACT|nr:hypothetical protein [Fulvivirga imtechensis]ELR71511.1 hypothetical protein C900_02574 [Fulvivirga imtechensis AK7]
MATSNSDYLKAFEKIIDSSNIQEASIALTEEQKIMLAMSDEDIQTGMLIDQDSLNKQEVGWLNEK